MKTTILMLIHFIGSQQTITIYTVPSMAQCHVIADAYKGQGQAICNNAPPVTEWIEENAK